MDSKFPDKLFLITQWRKFYVKVFLWSDVCSRKLSAYFSVACYLCFYNGNKLSQSANIGGFFPVDKKYDFFCSLSFPLRTGEVNRRKQTDLQKKTRKSLVGKVKQDLLMTYLQNLHLEWNDGRPELLIAFLMLDTWLRCLFQSRLN